MTTPGSLNPDTHFGQYRIVRLLGRGGMGEVYEVEHRVLERKYALKLLPPDFATRSEAVRRFEREAKVMANLEHPHIVRVDEFGETNGRYWLRMELVHGVETGLKAESGKQKAEIGSVGARCITLGDYAASRNGCIEQAELAGILKQVLEAVAFAHEKGVVHRDLKPGNILLEKDAAGNLLVRVSDFGLARVIGEEVIRSQAQMSVSRSLGAEKTLGRPESIDDAQTLDDEGASTRALLGTWEYMSPEQRRGEAADARSDVYALGLMCFRLLTGKELGFKMPSRLVAGLSAEWDTLVEKALEEDPGARYGSGREMLDASVGVSRLLAGGDSSRGNEAQASPPQFARPPKSPIATRKFKAPLIIVSAVALLLVCWAGWYFWKLLPLGNWREAQVEQQQIEWHIESVTETNSTWRGSYQNALDTLRLRSHAWKLVGYDAKKDKCEWGFKAVLEFPDHPDYRPDQFGGVPVMTISKIEYELYDKDGFRLASLSLSEGNLTVVVRETKTFEHTGFISSALARRAAYGKVNIQAGYVPEPSRPSGSPPPASTLTPAAAKRQAVAPASALPTWEETLPGENSLGMKFVSVPGTRVLFSVWDTRVKDYEAYAAASTGVGNSWKSPGFEQGPTHPVVNVSWDDAKAFCAWLTQKERQAGLISENQSYRLPTDAEWSVAVGLAEEGGGTPKDKDMKIKGVYPWGSEWPPPTGAGNYASSLKVDNYENTSPVGSFKANRYGLYDLGGNVWQWCEDWFDAEQKYRVLRGASWGIGLPVTLLSSSRLINTPDYRHIIIGFRCVLVVGSSP